MLPAKEKGQQVQIRRKGLAGASRFVRCCLLALGFAFVMSFIDDELFLKETQYPLESKQDTRGTDRNNPNDTWPSDYSIRQQQVEERVSKESGLSNLTEQLQPSSEPQLWNQTGKDDREHEPVRSDQTPPNETLASPSIASKPGKTSLFKSISTKIANSSLFSPPAKPREPYTIMVELSSDFGPQDLSRVAFARMLQLEIQETIRKRTEIKLYWHLDHYGEIPCFGSLNALERITDETYVTAKLHQQEEWLGEARSILLEPTKDVWQDAISVLKEAASLNLPAEHSLEHSNISLPFLHIGTSQKTPKLSGWKHVEDVKEFLRLNTSVCCQLEPPRSSETVLYLDDTETIPPTSLSTLLTPRWKWDRLVVVGDTPGALSRYFAPLQEVGWVVASVHRGSMNAGSIWSRYCYMRQTNVSFIGSLESELSTWTALTANAARIRMFGTQQRNGTVKGVSIEKIPPAPDATQPNRWEKLPWLRSNQTSNYSIPKLNSTNYMLTTAADTLAPSTSPTLSLDSDWRAGPLGTASNPISIVCELGGEMGNQLSRIAGCYGLKWVLEDDHNMTSQIVLRHQESRKWIRARRSVQQCFPKSREWDFEAGNTGHAKRQVSVSKSWLNERYEALFVYHGYGPLDVDEYLFRVAEAVKVVRTETPPQVQLNATVTVPNFYHGIYSQVGYFSDRYGDRLRELFEYETSNLDCCDLKPEPDEHVFHLRNFQKEMRNWKGFGFEDLSPHQLAYEAYAHLKEGDKVTFTLRGGIDSVQPFIDAFEERKIKVRAMKNNGDMQDFCYLMFAQREYMAYSTSTFGVWAGWLGNASKVRIYSILSAERIRMWGEHNDLSFNWTNSALKERVFFEMYKTAEYIEQEKREKESLNSTG